MEEAPEPLAGCIRRMTQLAEAVGPGFSGLEVEDLGLRGGVQGRKTTVIVPRSTDWHYQARPGRE